MPGMKEMEVGGKIKGGVKITRFEPPDFSEAVAFDAEAGGGHRPVPSILIRRYKLTSPQAEEEADLSRREGEGRTLAI